MKKAIIGCSVNLELVTPTSNEPGSKVIVPNLLFVAAGTSVNIGNVLSGHKIDTNIVGLVGENRESELLIYKIKEELFLDILPCRVLKGTPLTVACESKRGTRYICRKPGLLDEPEIIEAAKNGIVRDIVNHERTLRVATGVKIHEVEFAKILLFGTRLDDQFLVFNPSPSLIKDAPHHFESIASGVDLLVVNQDEAEAILRRPLSAAIKAEKFEMLRNLLKFSPSVLVTLGGKGSCYFTREETLDFIHMPAWIYNGLNTGGAGDSYLGHFLSAVSAGNSISDSMRYASVGATCKLTAGGGASNQPHPDTVINICQNFISM